MANGGGALRWEKVEPYGRVSVPGRSRWQLSELISEVAEYFDCGASLAPGSVVFDVGANIGAFALAAAKECDSQLELFCFEPVPPIFGALSANTSQNRLLADVETHLFQTALGAERDVDGIKLSYFRWFPTDSTIDLDGKRKDFEDFFAHHGELLRKRTAPIVSDTVAKQVGALVARMPKGRFGRWVSDQVTGRVEFECPMTTLSSIIDEHDVERIDLLKIDVEGAELSVLRGIEEAHWPRIQQVVLEGHDQNGQLQIIRELLTENGLEIARVDRPDGAEDIGLSTFLLYAKRSVL